MVAKVKESKASSVVDDKVPYVVTCSKSGIKVKNTHAYAICLESGILRPGEIGIATRAEFSCLNGQYVEQC